MEGNTLSKKKIILIQDGIKYPKNLGGYCRFAILTGVNLTVIIVDKGGYNSKEFWLLEANKASLGLLNIQDLMIVDRVQRQVLIDGFLSRKVFVGRKANSLHSKEFSDIVCCHEELVFIIGHESIGVDDEVKYDTRLCPLTIETSGTTTKGDTSLGLISVVCTLFNQVWNYTIRPIDKNVRS
eukprot:TRINITY_DN11820_c0_g1_i1.p1 TRINITY_DN11820_c0_g1~~TRINITY_DN11820_c0_g1_i1.p1  ORF type:complete len:182 (+),score=29.21 TRINITY_DN11820_c0_g1_i1:74-619(+)